MTCSRLWKIVRAALGLTPSVEGGAGKTQTPRSDSHYERRENADRVLVFVHGIGGRADDTWTCQTNQAYWPELITKDEAFAGFNVYVVAYQSSSWMNLDELVTNITTRLDNDDVFRHRDVVFVCHSMGGLIIQRFLLTYRRYAEHVPFIYFFSTPHTGSDLANIARLLNSSSLVRGLRSGEENESLRTIETQWLAAGFRIKRYCAYETKDTRGFRVVERLSATRHCDVPPVPINEDHFGIVKPHSTNHESYVALRSAIRENPGPTLTADEQRDEPSGDVKLTFKNSPLFTEARKRLITIAMNRLYLYLKSAGFDPPHEVPPVGTMRGSSIGALSGGFPVYRQSFAISEAALDDPMRIQQMYALYAFHSILNVGRALKSDLTFRQLAAFVLAEYFPTSLSDERPTDPGRANDWGQALWDIRQELGKEFMDRSLLYAVKGFDEPSSNNTKQEFAEYFSHRVIFGVAVVDNNLESLHRIHTLLQKRGLLPPPKPKEAPPAPEK